MRLLVIIMLLMVQPVLAQHRYTLIPVNGLNTEKDDILCGFIEGKPIYVSNDRQDLVNDYSWNTRYVFQLKIAERGNTYLDLHSTGRFLPFPGVRSEGTASFNPADSTLYFSSAESYGDSKGTHLRIYSTRWNGTSWSRPVLHPVCQGARDYAHPFYDPQTGVLFFSSNRNGGYGGMDIWYSYYSQGAWTEPVNPGMLVNTSAHEIFPSVFDGDLYFSSNGIIPSRGYELFYCEKKSQWKSAVQLQDPLNSPGDDVMIVFLDAHHGFVSSDRQGGKGGDDIYLFQREEAGLPPNTFAMELMVDGKPFPGAGIRVTNPLQEVLLQGVADESGRVDIRSLPMARPLRLMVTGVDPSLYPVTVLYLLDEHGNRVRELRINEFGWVDLELLPFDYSGVTLFPNADRSWLSVRIDGQVIGENDGSPAAPGQPITIVDDEGKPVALAYTEDGGLFSFDAVSPDLSYTFRLDEKSKASQVVVFEKGGQIVLPVLDAEAIYRRVESRQAIAIVNEFNEIVYVNPSDVFVVNRIYYDFGKSTLTDDAQEQLNQLAWLLNRNQALGIDVFSHTDSRGSSADNLRLSQQRAEAVLQFLEGKGVERSRMMAEGRGEQMLLNDCTDRQNCSDQEHAINRRTEIRFRIASR
jgi:outer membrane protein OmpA-like peptidoglycan-associated protein